MKHIVLFILLMSSFVSARAQLKIDSPLLRYMLNKDCITVSEAMEVTEDSLFASLYDVYLKRYNLNRGENRMVFFASSESNVRGLIQKMDKLGMLDDEVLDDIERKFANRKEKRPLLSETIFDELSLFQYLFELENARAKAYDMQVYLHELQEKSMIAEEVQFERVYASKSEIIDLLDRKLMINFDTLPESVEEAYSHVFHELRKLDRSLEISDFSFVLEERTYKDLKYESAVVHFSNSGSTYVAHNRYRNNDWQTGKGEHVDRRFYRIFNKVLADLESGFRVMDIEGTEMNMLCMVLVTEEQFLFLKAKNDGVSFRYFDPEWYKVEVTQYWNPFELLSQQETEHYFSVYDSIGLFRHLDHHQKEKELEKSRKTYLYSSESLLFMIDSTYLGFDWEMFDGNKPYKKAIEDFASITYGEFTPENIQDNFSFSNEEADISFDFRGKTYKTTVEVTGDWYAYGFLRLINQAIEENNLSGRLYELVGGGQMSVHIYLTPDQYEFLSENALFEFSRGEEE